MVIGAATASYAVGDHFVAVGNAGDGVVLLKDLEWNHEADEAVDSLHIQFLARCSLSWKIGLSNRWKRMA